MRSASDRHFVTDSFDYVIVGGGSAASVLANRLSQDGTRTVCVLEAGPPDRNPYIQIPAGFIKTLFDARITWQFQTEPNPATNDRRIQITQGKTLGGSSAVNGGVYNRGQAFDFDQWAQLGNRGWSYADVLPFFRRTERRVGVADPTYRGHDGALPITTPEWDSVLCDAFMASANACGLPTNVDYNGATQEGVGRYQAAILNGRRQSAAKVFLHPARHRDSVDVRTDARAKAITFDGKRASGVCYWLSDGTERTVAARREVIVSAGTLGSPKLLQLSGIGDPELLASLGVPAVHALRGVGRNLRDHYSPRFVWRVRGADTLNSHVRGLPLVREAWRWLRGRQSVLSLAPALCHGFGRTDAALDLPDYSLVFTPASYRQGRIGMLDMFPGMTCGVWQMRPESRGTVEIVSGDARDTVRVDPNYLSDPLDRAVLVAALRRAREIFAAPPISRYVEAETLPGPDAVTDDELLAFARQYGSSSYHLIGTCRMGPADDPAAVVSSALSVHGVERLRVVDASIMPTMPSANTYAATLMIAEKAAEMILTK